MNLGAADNTSASDTAVNLEMAVSRFLVGYFSTCRRAAKTSAAYAADLSQFCQSTAPTTALADLGPAHIEQWVHNMKERGYAAASLRRKVAALRVFFAYWLRMGILQRSPLSRIRLDLGKDKTLFRTLHEIDLRALLGKAATATHQTSGRRTGRFLAIRNQAVLELLFATGLRVGELAQLTLPDVSPTHDALVVNGKGGKQRIALLVDPRSRKILAHYIACRRSFGAETESLFVNVCHRPLSVQAAAGIVKNGGEAAGIRRRVTPHMLRHSVATMLLTNGANLRIVQEFLGHASIVTTQRYTHVSKETLRASLLDTHPNLLQIRRLSSRSAATT